MSIVYTECAVNCMKKVLDLGNDTIRCNLMTTGHGTSGENPDNIGWASVSAFETSGAGYLQNNLANDLVDPAVDQDDANNKAVFRATNKSWTGLTIDFQYAVLYDETSPGNVLMCSIDFTPQSLNDSDLEIQWNADGIFTYG